MVFLRISLAGLCSLLLLLQSARVSAIPQSPGKIHDRSFQEAVLRYVEMRQRTSDINDLALDEQRQQIEDLVFDSKNQGDYSHSFSILKQFITHDFATHPEPLYEIALALQLAWHAKFPPYVRNWRDRCRAEGAELGSLLGSTLVLLALKKGMALPHVFQLLGVAFSTTVGAAAGQSTHGKIAKSWIPPAPASLLTDTPPQTHSTYALDLDHRILGETLKGWVYLRATQATLRTIQTVRAAQTANRATAITKITPPVILISALAYAATEAVETGIDALDRREFEKQIQRSRLSLTQALNQNQVAQARWHAHQLANQVIALSLFQNRKIFEVLLNLNEDLENLEPNQAQQRMEQAERRIHYLSQTADVPYLDEDDERLALALLDEMDDLTEPEGEGVDLPNALTLARMDALKALYSEWAKQNSNDTFADYLNAMERSRQREYSERFQNQAWRDHPNSVLVEAVSFLETLPKTVFSYEILRLKAVVSEQTGKQLVQNRLGCL